MQQGKDKKLSGAIAGGADTFFGKSKSADHSKILSYATTVLAIVFVGIVVAMYLFI
jgi:preprotein translocase subunit SecG